MNKILKRKRWYEDNEKDLLAEFIGEHIDVWDKFIELKWKKENGEEVEFPGEAEEK